MKIRDGFVSNSSSSSFVVIDNSGNHWYPNWSDFLVVDGEFAETTEFGWGPGVVRDPESKIVFAYLQALYSQQEYVTRNYKYPDNWMKMLENVIKKSTGVREILWNVTDSYEDEDKTWAYIDHQSSVVDMANTEIFDSEETLANFIFGEKSCVVLDNDNH